MLNFNAIRESSDIITYHNRKIVWPFSQNLYGSPKNPSGHLQLGWWLLASHLALRPQVVLWQIFSHFWCSHAWWPGHPELPTHSERISINIHMPNFNAIRESSDIITYYDKNSLTLFTKLMWIPKKSFRTFANRMVIVSFTLSITPAGCCLANVFTFLV